MICPTVNSMDDDGSDLKANTKKSMSETRWR